MPELTWAVLQIDRATRQRTVQSLYVDEATAMRSAAAERRQEGRYGFDYEAFAALPGWTCGMRLAPVVSITDAASDCFRAPDCDLCADSYAEHGYSTAEGRRLALCAECLVREEERTDGCGNSSLAGMGLRGLA